MNTFIINQIELNNVFYPSFVESMEIQDQNFYISKQYYKKKENLVKYNYFIVETFEDIEQITKKNNNLY